MCHQLYWYLCFTFWKLLFAQDVVAFVSVVLVFFSFRVKPKECLARTSCTDFSSPLSLAYWNDDKCLICGCTHHAVTISINSDRCRQRQMNNNNDDKKTLSFIQLSWMGSCAAIYVTRKFMRSQALNLTWIKYEEIDASDWEFIYSHLTDFIFVFL